MKKFVLFAAALMFSACLSANAFAEEVKGVVESINMAKHEIVIKNNASGASKTVVVHPKVIAMLSVGSSVRATLKSGSNVAETIGVQVG